MVSSGFGSPVAQPPVCSIMTKWDRNNIVPVLTRVTYQREERTWSSENPPMCVASMEQLLYTPSTGLAQGH